MSWPNPIYGTLEEQATALAAFIARHARLYDPATDAYDRPPFAADIKEGKNDPIYNAHSYHTKVPPRSIIPYILHYTQPGDLVLDLFCGSGMTGVAAQMCANPPADILEQFPDLKDRVGPRACILNDLSPAACHIAYNYNTPFDVADLKREFERIKATVKEEFEWLYGTEHYEPAVGVYDPTNAEVACRLKNPPADDNIGLLLGGQERTWELVTKAEVESRLGYPVTNLPRRDEWGALNVAAVEQWVCIPATIQYTVWSDVYRCEGLVTVKEFTRKISSRGKNVGRPIVSRKRVARGCGKEISLWDVAVDLKQAVVSETFACASCGQLWKKIQLTRTSTVPVLTNYKHDGLRAVRRGGERRVAATTPQTDRPTTARERVRIREISESRIPWSFPTDKINTKGPQYTRNALSARSVSQLSDFYSRRNLIALARLWRESTTSSTSDGGRMMLFALTSTFGHIERMTRYKFKKGGNSSLSGQLYFPSFPVEDNVLRQLTTKVRQISRAVELLWPPNAHEVASHVMCGHAGVLAGIPDAAIDYVFADPPFGSNIYYNEVNWLYECWLGKHTDETREAVVHRQNDRGTKSIDDYSRLMTEALCELWRVLKPGRWATIEFNNNDGRVFEAVKHAIRHAGFEIVNMLLLDKAQKTFKQVKGAEGVEDVVDKDVLFNLHKAAVAGPEVGTAHHDMEQHVAAAVRQHLQTLPGRIRAEPAKYNEDHRTTATINSMLMNVLIPRGVNVDRLNLPFIERVCGRFFRKVGQRWYLRGEAVGNHTGPATLVEEEVAITDEITAIEWLRQMIKARPALIGELKPLWMRATGLLPAELSQVLVLEDLLMENFWRDADSNRWREPTAEEREKMSDDRSIRVLHDAERFVAGSLRRTTTDAERCEWIDVLFQACRAIEDDEQHAIAALRGFERVDGYRLITRLFQTILRESVAKDAFARAEKQMRAASQRAGQEAEAQAAVAEKRRVKAQGPTLFGNAGQT